MKKLHKGQLGGLVNVFLTFAVIVIVAAIALLIGANVQQQTDAIAGANSLASQGVNKSITATKQITDWLPIVVVVVIGALLVGLVLSAFKNPAM